LEDVGSRNTDRDGDHARELSEKDAELEAYKTGMEEALMELEELRLVSVDPDILQCVHANPRSL
jgi:hypothetical protein